jgi:hypothetical protein
VRAYLAGTYGTADIVSNNARVDVVFGTKIVVSTKGGFTNGKVTIDPAIAGANVQWQQLVNKKWVKIVDTKSSSAGISSLRWNTTRNKTYTVRAYVTDPAGNIVGAVTSTRTIKSS